MRLDPTRVASDNKSSRRKHGWPPGLYFSLLLHSLPLLALINWRPTPADTPTAIPIELALEQPPPAPAQPEPANPQQRRLASADLAEAEAAEAQPGTSNTPAAPGGPEAPIGAQTAAAQPPLPSPEPVASEEQTTIPAQPRAVETETAAVAPPLPPKPAPRKQPPRLEMSLPMTSGWPLPLHQNDPHEPQRLASLTGPPAIRDEYCVRALYLTLRHLDLLPSSFLGGRRGSTVLRIRIFGDGTINSVNLAQSSGYPDIDQRIQRMVFAVGQYPPLPPRMPGTWVDFTFVMAFPAPSQR